MKKSYHCKMEETFCWSFDITVDLDNDTLDEDDNVLEDELEDRLKKIAEEEYLSPILRYGAKNYDEKCYGSTFDYQEIELIPDS